MTSEIPIQQKSTSVWGTIWFYPDLTDTLLSSDSVFKLCRCLHIGLTMRTFKRTFSTSLN